MANAGGEQAPDPTATGTVAPGDDFERLRELLLGEERRALAAARARIAELEQRQGELPRRLPEAALAALRDNADNPRIASALASPVGQALGEAVHNNRQSIIDALFPVIGPMIRRAIAEALRGLVDNLNGAIESSFTLRGLKWRFEAWRGGVPYAQVVLRHRLAYGIDHVFLIERNSGLLLRHASAPGLAPLDADAIAGMLTALGDFVGDSVGRDGGVLDAAQVGESLVWVEHGPLANLACFVRGVPPPRLRELLKQRLEEIHALMHAAADDVPLAERAGDARVGELIEPLPMLRDAHRDEAAGSTPRASRRPLLLALLLALVALGWWVSERWRWQAQLTQLRDTLAHHPGFVLGRIEARPWRSLVVHGLLDPDAVSPQAALDAADLGDASRRLQVTGFVATADEVVLRRAQRLLTPPDGVRLQVAAGVLRLEGVAPPEWIAAAQLRAPLIAGVRAVDSTLHTATDPREIARAVLARLAGEITARTVTFTREDEPVAGSAAVVDALAADLRRAQAAAAQAGVQLRVRSVGSSDESGGEETNVRVRSLRLRWLALALAARGIDAVAEGDASVNADPTRRGARVELRIEDGAR